MVLVHLKLGIQSEYSESYMLGERSSKLDLRNFPTVKKLVWYKKSAFLGQYCTTLHTKLLIFPMQSSSLLY